MSLRINQRLRATLMLARYGKIICFSMGSGGPLLRSFLELREKHFGNKYAPVVIRHDGTEIDCYDTPHAIYIVWEDRKSIVRAGARLLPTMIPYMLECAPDWQNWDRGPLPKSPSVMEMSRLVVDDPCRNFPEELRERVKQLLIFALLEFCLKNGIRELIGVMNPWYWRSCFDKAGWGVTHAGSEAILDGEPCRVGHLPVTNDLFEKVLTITEEKCNQRPVSILVPRGQGILVGAEQKAIQFGQWAVVFLRPDRGVGKWFSDWLARRAEKRSKRRPVARGPHE